MTDAERQAELNRLQNQVINSCLAMRLLLRDAGVSRPVTPVEAASDLMDQCVMLANFMVLAKLRGGAEGHRLVRDATLAVRHHYQTLKATAINLAAEAVRQAVERN